MTPLAAGAAWAAPAATSRSGAAIRPVNRVNRNNSSNQLRHLDASKNRRCPPRENGGGRARAKYVTSAAATTGAEAGPYSPPPSHPNRRCVPWLRLLAVFPPALHDALILPYLDGAEVAELTGNEREALRGGGGGGGGNGAGAG